MSCTGTRGENGWSAKVDLVTEMHDQGMTMDEARETLIQMGFNYGPASDLVNFVYVDRPKYRETVELMKREQDNE